MTEIAIGARFDSYAEFQEAFKKYCSTNCAVFTSASGGKSVESVNKNLIGNDVWPGHLKYVRKKLGCKHFGPRRSAGRGIRPHQKTFKSDCPAYMLIVADKHNCQLVIKELNENHNHILSPEYLEFYPESRRPSPWEQDQAGEFMSLQVKCPPTPDFVRKRSKKLVTVKDIAKMRSVRTMAVAAPKFVIDTDVGSDDAMAIILCAAAESRGEAEILGITCVHGITTLSNVCINTLKTLDTLNRLDIPVYKGTKRSIIQSLDWAHNINAGDGFGDFKYPNPPNVNLIQSMHAVNYLTSVAAEKPGEITVMCLGPLTNIALAIRMDPDFCNNVKHIIIMGGNNEGVGARTAAAEYNFYCDPEAAFVVIHNMKCPITIFPWDTAMRHGKISYDWRKNVLGKIDTPQAILMNKVERVILDGQLYDDWHRCDPLTAAVAINPAVATRQVHRYATVELNGQFTRGALVVDHLEKLDMKPNVTIVERVDVKLYKDMLIEAFSMDV